LWVGLTILSLGIAFAYSRAISLIWLVGTLTFILLAWRSAASRQNLLAYAVLAFVAYAMAVALVPEVGARVTGGGDLATTLDVRRVMIESALAIWRDYPVLGAGIGTFRVLYPTYRSLADQVTAGNTPHNDYVLALAEGGPLLLAFYLVMFAAVAWRGVRVALRLLRGGAPVALSEAAIAIACGAIFAHAFVNFVMITLSLQLLLGCLVGLLFSHGMVAREDAGAPPVPRRTRQAVVGLSIVALLIPFRALAQDAMAYSVVIGQPGMPFAATITKKGKRYLAFLSWLDAVGPVRGLPAFGAASYYDSLANRTTGAARSRYTALAEEHYAMSIERLPINHRAYLAWAQLALRSGQRDLDKAATLSRIASSIDPADVVVYETRVRIELQRRRPEAAYRILRDEFFPWSYYGASTRALVAEKLLLQLRRWSLEYGDGPPVADIDARLYRAQRIIEAVRTERALGWRE
jgi:hypothetical protein